MTLMSRMLTTALCCLSLLGARLGEAQVNLAAIVGENGFSGQVPTGISWFAATYRIPVVAEIIFDNTISVTVPPGALSASSAMTNLLVGTPLAWEEVGNVIHIYDPRIVSASSFLDHRFQWFRVPETATQFSYLLVQRLGNEWITDPNASGFMGIAGSEIDSSYLDPGKCKPEDLSNVTARELLYKEAAAARFVTIVTYQNVKQLRGDAAWKFVSKNWFWSSVDRPPMTVPVSPL